ncbi:MAG TPA: hypothetical protein VMF30_09280 [Pirellulales bacterium]|nr:hypothetical protein [Pirellulales bacterium]
MSSTARNFILLALAAAWLGKAIPATGDEPPAGAEDKSAVPLTPFEAAEFFSGRFTEALSLYGPAFVDSEARNALRGELRGYLEEHVRMQVQASNATAIARAITQFVQRNFDDDSYLRFRPRFDALKWQIWTATERRAYLTPDERQAILIQRLWMIHYLEQVAVARLPAGLSADTLKLMAETRRLERNCFFNPLNPFFDEPMSEEDFETFRRHVMSDEAPKNARKQLFLAAVYTRSAELKRRWPPGFAARSMHVYGTYDFDFAPASDEWDVEWRWDHKPDSRHVLLDVADNNTLEPPLGLEEEEIANWLAENKQGDLSFDVQAGEIRARHGARLATLHEFEWQAIDRVPLAALRERLAAAPLESMHLVKYQAAERQPQSWSESWQEFVAEVGMAAQPAVVLETGDGKLVVLRVERNDDQTLLIRGRAWPRRPNPPFHSGDDEATDSAGADTPGKPAEKP